MTSRRWGKEKRNVSLNNRSYFPLFGPKVVFSSTGVSADVLLTPRHTHTHTPKAFIQLLTSKAIKNASTLHEVKASDHSSTSLKVSKTVKSVPEFFSTAKRGQFVSRWLQSMQLKIKRNKFIHCRICAIFKKCTACN